MNEQYQYSRQVLTPNIAKELIHELFDGETVQRQEIIRKVDEVHRERGGQSRARVHHPIGNALSKMAQLGLAKRPEYGLWYILPRIKTLNEFMKWIGKFDRGDYVFRGVPNAKYGIQASAFRRPEEEERTFEKFLQINRDLIRNARLRGYDQKDGRELKELEILADLQHFKAATCLIDFSYSAQVALWFACDSDTKNQDNSSDAKVFAVRVRNRYPNRFREITPKLLKEDIDHFLEDGEESQLYHWQPRQQNHRIIAQQSIFLFGTYEFDSDDECVIAEDSRQNILDELEKASGITEDKLFPDLEGFAYVHREGAQYTEHTPSEYNNLGLQARENENYDEAIDDFDMAIELDSGYAAAYYERGLTRVHRDQDNDVENAIDDFDMAIELDSGYAAAYYERGLTRVHRDQDNDVENAIDDFDMAIELDPDYAAAYYARAAAKSKLELYEEAFIDSNRAIELDPDYAAAYYARGISQINLGMREEAFIDSNRAIELDPDYAAAYRLRGFVQMRQMNFASALVDFDEAIRLGLDDAHIYAFRAETHLNLRHFANARLDSENALERAMNAGLNELIDRINNNLLPDIDFYIAGEDQDE